jgi:hypothetical protein
MIIDGVIQNENSESFYGEVIGWAHQCWQLHILGNDIDLDEFKRRMNVDDIDYKQFMLDNQEKLDLNESGDKLYMLRIMHVLYPEEYANPDQE